MRFSNFRRQFLFIFFVMLCLDKPALASTAHNQEPESLEQLVQKARGLINLSKYKDAKKVLSKALKQHKNSYDANLLMSIVHKNIENRKEAIRFAYAAVKLQPENPEGHYMLAVLFFETNESGQASRELELAFQKGANFAFAYALKGYLNLVEQNYKAALEDFEKAMQLVPKDNPATAKWKENVEFLKSYVDFNAMVRDSSIMKPVPLNFPRPNYTEEARGKGVQGAVSLIVWVSEQGIVKGWILRTRLGYGLDEQAILAARQLRFRPAMKDGNPIAYWQAIAVEFNLR